MGVGPRELGSGPLGGEHPDDLRAIAIALLLPGGNFTVQGVTIGDAAVDALGAQDTDLDLDHVEPARVLGRVVEFKTPQDAVGLRRREGVVERARRMAGQVIQDDPDPVGLGIMNVDEIAHAVGEVDGRAPLGDLYLTPRAMSIDEDEQVGRSVAPVLVVVTLRRDCQEFRVRAAIVDPMEVLDGTTQSTPYP